jgi:cytochrome c553
MTRFLPFGGGRGRGWSLLAAPFLFCPGLLLADTTPARIGSCEACHGPGGNSITPLVPSIAQQPALYLENQLVFFREGLRNSPVMEQVLKEVKDEELTALAKHFAAQKARVAAGAGPEAAKMARGRELVGKNHCGQCHLPSLQGQAQMPRLAGQREDYLLHAMIGYRDGKRTAADTTMSEVLYGMSDADLAAVAHYMARVE